MVTIYEQSNKSEHYWYIKGYIAHGALSHSLSNSTAST